MFRNAYQSIESSIVAVVQKFHSFDFPPIVGTGFFVSEEGVVCTCRHVVEAFDSLPRPEGFNGTPAEVLLFREVAIEGRQVWGWSVIEIISAGHATFEAGRPDFLAPEEEPDTSFLLLNVRDTPTVTFAAEPAIQGEVIAFAGFPMGSEALRGTKRFRQLSPSLHWGIVSAIFPNRVARTPYGFLIHANTQGGASGSPVFRDDGTVCGMVYMGLPEYYTHTSRQDQGQTRITYEVPTALTGCISGRRIYEAVELVRADAARWQPPRQTLAELLRNAVLVDAYTGQPYE
jgi:hypothetical protein